MVHCLDMRSMSRTTGRGIARLYGADCSGLLIPDTFLGEDVRHTEVFDEQKRGQIYLLGSLSASGRFC